jgi:hypothetical protein
MREALDLQRKALASDEKTSEEGHPTIANREANLALMLQDLGNLEEARDLLRKALVSLEEWLGPDHRSTKIVRGNLERLG